MATRTTKTTGTTILTTSETKLKVKSNTQLVHGVYGRSVFTF
jgi:hypothetical protein